MRRTRALAAVGAALLVVAAGGIWSFRGPGPMAFARGQKVALVEYKDGNPTGAPASLSNASLLERGEYLTRAADCKVCHTVPGGKEFAGGLGINLPFGTLYSTNITADAETGIGKYSDQDFLNALHRGRRRDGARLYPAMPYTSYTYVSDADGLAIKAYLFSLAPVRATIPANTLMFPFNQRWAMIFWSAMFSPNVRFEPNPSQSPEWNRGAYLAEALAHCGECHTPRNVQHHFGQGHRRRGLERRRPLRLSFDRPCRRARHRLRADGRGRRPEYQPVCARGRPRRGGLSAHGACNRNN
jgi:mono/diheme cytochrome c family protein